MTQNLDEEIMKSTVQNYPYFRTSDPSQEMNQQFQQVYDPAFLLHAFCDGCRNSVSIDMIQLIKSGTLSFVFASLAIADNELRSVALETIQRIKEGVLFLNFFLLTRVGSF